MPVIKTGIVVATLIIEHLCRVLQSYRPKMDATIAAAVTGGAITTVQADILKTFLDGAQTACNIIRLVSGY